MEKTISVKDVVRQTATELLTELNDAEIEDITDQLIESKNYKAFIKEMESLIFAKAKER